MPFTDALRIVGSRLNVVIAVLCIGLVAAFVGWKLSKPTYKATASVMLDSTSALGATVSNGSFLGTDMPSLLTGDTLLSRFERQQNLKIPLKDLRKNITADVASYSAIMPITYQSNSAKGALDGANTLADDLHAYYREISTRRYDDLATYLSTALDSERKKLEATDRQLAHLVAGDPFLTQSSAAQAIGAQLLALDQQRDEINATMQSHAIAAQMAGERLTDLEPTVKSELRSADPDFSALSTQVSKDKAAEAVLQSQYTSQYNGISSLQDQIKRSNQILEAERKRAEAEDPGNSPTYGQLIKDRDSASAVYRGDQAQLAAIERQINESEAHLAGLPNLGVQVASLQRDRDAANTAYQILAEQRTLTLSQQAQSAALGSITIVDRATVADRSIGKLALLVPIAAFLAFVVLAIALPFGLELVDERLHRRTTIEALYGRPLIGRVPV